MAGEFSYSSFELARIAEEPPKQSLLPEVQSLETHRAAFTRDHARVLRSAALRRLADKTQVVRPGKGDTPRMRLTHSLEVAQISCGIANELDADKDLTELAGLTHDIRHPPYGRNGERALNETATGCGGFEGNAQTLRILTRPKPKVFDNTGEPCGLNLTRAALDAACKYPWTPVDPDGQPRHKYGTCQEDIAILQQIRQGAPHDKQCLEAQIVDWSDDVAYSVHDVEDGIVSGRVDLSVLWDTMGLATFANKGAAAFGGDSAELVEAAGRLVGLPVVSAATSYDGSLRSLVALKRMTSELIGHFTTISITGTRTASGSTLPLERYDADLAVPSSVLAEVTTLKTIAVLYVIDLPRHIRRQERGHDRLFRLTEYLQGGAPGILDPMFRWFHSRTKSGQMRLRVTVDQLASMTKSRVERLDRQIASTAAVWGQLSTPPRQGFHRSSRSGRRCSTRHPGHFRNRRRQQYDVHRG